MRLLRWDQIPPWLQDNSSIHGGYRPASNSLRDSFGSLLYLHNESVNIWTHLVGALTFLALSWTVHSALGERYESASRADVLAFGAFFLGAALCLGMSATYHTISNHSQGVASWGNKLDYAGIVLLTTGSFVGSVYYGFFCHPALQRVYWTMISSIGVGCTTAAVLPAFRTPRWRPLRAGMFVAMGLSAVFPVFHGMKMFGLHAMKRHMGLYWVILEGVLYILGAGIYAARVPESIRPGSHDLWGASHQIFHVLVLLAAGSHLMALIKAFDHNHALGSCLNR